MAQRPVYANMNAKAIHERKARETIKFDLAVQIREMFDAARKQYGSTEWDDDEIELRVMELVTEE